MADIQYTQANLFREPSVKPGRVPKIGRPRVHSLDECAFDELTPEARYWVGFLLADGCIREGGTRKPETLSVALKGADAEHLERLRSFIKSAAPVARMTRTSGSKKTPDRKYPTARLSVCSQKLCARLVELGVVPRKSSREEAIPPLKNCADFWRGVVDGDGTVMLTKSRQGPRPTVALGSSQRLVTQFRDFARGLSGTSANGRHIKNGYWTIMLNWWPAWHVAKTLYENACVALPRKAEGARQIMQHFEGKTNRVGPRQFFDRADGGDSMLLSEWSARTGVAYHVLYHRVIRMKWSLEKAITTPVGKRGGGAHRTY